MLVGVLLRLVFAFAAVQATRLPVVVANVLCHAEGDCDDCDDRSDCHCPPGCPKCPYPPSHAASEPPPSPARLGPKLVAPPASPDVRPRPPYADAPPPQGVPTSVWRPPRAAC
ncbi:MAG TPA: hypothetical protein VFS43_20800 [Polyangiaceae bacterium]|nr:hypothetical protein [Polyangiaceae bacterium]